MRRQLFVAYVLAGFVMLAVALRAGHALHRLGVRPFAVDTARGAR